MYVRYKNKHVFTACAYHLWALLKIFALFLCPCSVGCELKNVFIKKQKSLAN